MNKSFEKYSHDCARDDGMRWIILHRGGPYLVVLSSGCGHLFYHESYCDQSVIMTIYGFEFFCDVSSGVGICPYMTYGLGLPIYGSTLAPWVFGVHNMCLTLLLLINTYQNKYIWYLIHFCIRIDYRLTWSSLYILTKSWLIVVIN